MGEWGRHVRPLPYPPATQQKLHSLRFQTVISEMPLKACESQDGVPETSRASIPPTLERWPPCHQMSPQCSATGWKISLHLPALSMLL